MDDGTARNVGITLRAAEICDADAVGELLNRSWRTHYAELLPARYRESMNAETHAREFRERLNSASPLCRAVVADAAGAVVGWAFAGTSRAELAGVARVRAVELHQLYVGAPGRGLGALLLEAALPDGAPAELWVFEANTSAQRFYQRHGFAPDGHRHSYLPECDGGIGELRFVR